jgi:hypothetical protein
MPDEELIALVARVAAQLDHERPDFYYSDYDLEMAVLETMDTTAPEVTMNRVRWAVYVWWNRDDTKSD